MIFVLLFLVLNIFAMENTDGFVVAKSNSQSIDFFVRKDNIKNFGQLIMQQKTTNSTIFIDGTQDNKINITILNELLDSIPNPRKGFEESLYNTIKSLKDKHFSKIVTQTHAIALVSSLGILLFKKYCHRNAAFLLIGSLSIPYYYNYYEYLSEYLKEQYSSNIFYAISDFGIFAFLGFILLGADKILAYL